MKKTPAQAELYKKHADIPKLINQRLLEKIAMMSIEPHRILEVGSGPNIAGDTLKSQFPNAHYYATDINLAMLGHFPKNETRLVANAQQLPFKAHAFSLIYSALCLEWSLMLPQWLKEIKRCLQANGVFCFATLGPSSLIELRKAWKSLDQDHEHVNYFYDMHDLGDMLQHQGFQHPVIEREDLTLLYRQPLTLLKELKNLGSMNMTPKKCLTLGHPKQWRQLSTHYPTQAEHEGYYPVTLEVIYGHAFGSNLSPEEKAAGTTRINVASIRRAPPK